MPTQTGSIWAQNIGYRIVDSGISTITLRLANNNITAETAIALLVPDIVGGNRARAFWVECGISRIVSNGVSEAFDPPLPRIKRSNVTEIRLRGAVVHCRMRYRWVINFWQ